MELRCPSYDYVLDMTWSEFQIRAFAYRRMQENKELLAREISWNSLLAPHIDYKKLPKTKQKFWQIGQKQSSVNDGMKEAMKAAQEEYFKAKQLKDNG